MKTSKKIRITILMLVIAMVASILIFSACGDDNKGKDSSGTQYVITFDAGKGTCEVPTAKTSANGTLAGVPTPERTGFAFNGWFTSSDSENEITEATVFTADTTVYASWTAQGDNYRDNTMPETTFDVTLNSFTKTMGTEENSWIDVADVVWTKTDPLKGSVTYYYEAVKGPFRGYIYFNNDGTVDSLVSYPTSGRSAGLGTWTQEGNMVTFYVTDTRALTD